MKSPISNYYWLVVSYIYEKVFNEKMSVDITNFFKNISYVGFGTFIAMAFSVTFNVLSGRFLGPTEYGKFSLVQSIAMFLYIPMLMGYSVAIIKYTAEEDNLDKQKYLISTTYILVTIFTIVSVCIYLLMPQAILDYLSLSTEVFHISIVFAVIFVIFTLTTSTLRGLHEMKKYAILTPIYSFILLLIFLLFISIKFLSYKSAIFSICSAYIIVSSIILIYIRKYFIYKFDKLLAYKLTNYGLYAIIGATSFVFYSNIDQLVINMYMSAEDVGIYKAYNLASIDAAGVIFGIFNTVFFPFASKCEDKNIILKKINKAIPYLIGCGIPFIIVSEFVILKLYGGAYTINFLLMISFAIVSILIVYFGLYDWTFCSQGIEGVKLVNKSTIIIAIVNIVLDLYLIPYMGIFGATISTSTAFIIGIYLLVKRGNMNLD